MDLILVFFLYSSLKLVSLFLSIIINQLLLSFLLNSFLFSFNLILSRLLQYIIVSLINSLSILKVSLFAFFFILYFFKLFFTQFSTSSILVVLYTNTMGNSFMRPTLYCFILFLISLELPILYTSSSTFNTYINPVLLFLSIISLFVVFIPS